jgi:parallel beta-helix repeat protein
MKTMVSGMLLTALLLGTVCLAFRVQLVKASGTIYIRPDGSVNPPTVPIRREEGTYTLTDNVSSSADGIVVQKDNITLDGAGHSLQGASATGYTGIFLTGRSNVTIKNIRIENFYDGIWFDSSSHCNITSNSLATNGYDGIYLHSCLGSSVADNAVTGSAMHGIGLDSCFNMSVAGNTVRAGNGCGIMLYDSNSISVARNNVTANALGCGVRLYSSSSNSVAANVLAENAEGIHLEFSSNNNSIMGNAITGNHEYGIALKYSSNGNSIVGNDITDNSEGISFSSSLNNTIYHNNFVSNTNQASSAGSTNVWDNGYPFGGNYYSDYKGVDMHWGVFQNETGHDGIGDTSYTVDASNQDRFPLMNQIAILIGDVTGDGYVGIDDLFTVALHFGSEIGQPKYDRVCDVNFDGYVGIDDLFLVAGHFGEENG